MFAIDLMRHGKPKFPSAGNLKKHIIKVHGDKTHEKMDKKLFKLELSKLGMKDSDFNQNIYIDYENLLKFPVMT